MSDKVGSRDHERSLEASGRSERARGPASVRWRGRRVKPVTAPGLQILFVGLNPGRYSAARGHHFAGPGNHFWRLLADSGMAPHRLRPDEDSRLPDYGLGVTNIVERPSPGSNDLGVGELRRGGARLRVAVAGLAPAVLCLLGKEVYLHYAGLGSSVSIAWGLQDGETVPGVREFVAPNPSSRSTIPYGERLALFRALARLAVRSQP